MQQTSSATVAAKLPLPLLSQHPLPATSIVMVDGQPVEIDNGGGGADRRAWWWYNDADKADCVLDGTPEAPGFLATKPREYHGWQESVEALGGQPVFRCASTVRVCFRR